MSSKSTTTAVPSSTMTYTFHIALPKPSSDTPNYLSPYQNKYLRYYNSLTSQRTVNNETTVVTNYYITLKNNQNFKQPSQIGSVISFGASPYDSIELFNIDPDVSYNKLKQTKTINAKKRNIIDHGWTKIEGTPKAVSISSPNDFSKADLITDSNNESYKCQAGIRIENSNWIGLGTQGIPISNTKGGEHGECAVIQFDPKEFTYKSKQAISFLDAKQGKPVNVPVNPELVQGSYYNVIISTLNSNTQNYTSSINSLVVQKPNAIIPKLTNDSYVKFKSLHIQNSSYESTFIKGSNIENVLTVQYTINFDKVTQYDIFNILVAISNAPDQTNSYVNKNTDYTFEDHNQNTAYSMMIDYCMLKKTACTDSNAKSNFCCLKYSSNNIPTILQRAALSKSTDSFILQKYNQVKDVYNSYPNPILEGKAVPSHPQAKDIYMNFCNKDNNWLLQDCQTFYSNMFHKNSNKLDLDVQTLLKEKCKTTNKNDGICSCFQDPSVYSNYATENQYPSMVTLSPYQCWYPKCFYSKLQEYNVYPCPSNTVCTANVYNNLKAGGNINNNQILTSQTVQCGTSIASKGSVPLKSTKGTTYYSTSVASPQASSVASPQASSSVASPQPQAVASPQPQASVASPSPSSVPSSNRQQTILIVVVISAVVLIISAIFLLRGSQKPTMPMMPMTGYIPTTGGIATGYTGGMPMAQMRRR